jgi:tetratricopeptide (TPR) repeat protein
MAGSGSLHEFPGFGPDVFLLPFAVSNPDEFGDLDAGVVSRRIPDFLHQILNHGDIGPTGLLEIQSPPEDGPVRWIVLRAPPSPEDAFGLLPDEETARAVVTGRIEADAAGFWVEVYVHALAEPEIEITETVTMRTLITRANPVRDLRRLAERLAKTLDLPPPVSSPGLWTASGPAFFKFLEGLDGAALLSGDLSIEPAADRARLMRPFAEALGLDPKIGLALRTAHMAMSLALEGERIAAPECLDVIDDCLRAQPGDGEGCVAVAEQLAGMGHADRALAWLEHATHLNPPPARGLESLGIHFANVGDTVQARHLWLQGLSVDGHPDFLGHLARLAFADGNEDEAWDKVLRGLRRICERQLRADEWPEDGRGCGVMLRYLVDELEQHRSPPEVAEALIDLVDALVEDEDRIDLGLCLIAVKRADLGRAEIVAGLEGTPDDVHRDAGVRALLVLDVPGFDRRFAKAVDQVVGKRDPRPALSEFEQMLALQSEFWPAHFFRGIARKRLGDDDGAIDAMAEVLRLRPGQSDALTEMASLFDRRGNPKRALECIDEALSHRPGDAQMHALRAEFLKNLGRIDDAREALQQAMALDPDESAFKRAWKRMK